jgi:hypothetical protein
MRAVLVIASQKSLNSLLHSFRLPQSVEVKEISTERCST